MVTVVKGRVACAQGRYIYVLDNAVTAFNAEGTQMAPATSLAVARGGGGGGAAGGETREVTACSFRAVVALPRTVRPFPD